MAERWVTDLHTDDNTKVSIEQFEGTEDFEAFKVLRVGETLAGVRIFCREEFLRKLLKVIEEEVNG